MNKLSYPSLKEAAQHDRDISDKEYDKVSVFFTSYDSFLFTGQQPDYFGEEIRIIQKYF